MCACHELSGEERVNFIKLKKGLEEPDDLDTLLSERGYDEGDAKIIRDAIDRAGYIKPVDMRTAKMTEEDVKRIYCEGVAAGKLCGKVPSRENIKDYLANWYSENCPVPMPYYEFIDELADAILVMLEGT